MVGVPLRCKYGDDPIGQRRCLSLFYLWRPPRGHCFRSALPLGLALLHHQRHPSRKWARQALKMTWHGLDLDLWLLPLWPLMLPPLNLCIRLCHQFLLPLVHVASVVAENQKNLLFTTPLMLLHALLFCRGSKRRLCCRRMDIPD